MRKSKVVLGLSIAVLFLAACSESPDDKITEKVKREYEIQKEINQLADVVDETFDRAEKYKNTLSEIENYGKEVVNKEISLGESVLSYKTAMYGYDEFLVQSVSKRIELEMMKKELKQKDIDKMKTKLMNNYFKGYANDSKVVGEYAVKLAYWSKINDIKKEDVENLYINSYQEKVYKGLIDAPKYEDNEEYYEVLYMINRALSDGVDIEKSPKHVTFGKNYKWVENEIFKTSSTDDNMGLERNKDDVVFEVNGEKITLKDIMKDVYENNYFKFYEQTMNIEVYKEYLKINNINTEEVKKSWATLGYDVLNENELATIIVLSEKFEESGFFDKNNFEDYFSNIKANLRRLDDEKMNDSNVVNFYKYQMILEYANSEEIKGMQMELWKKSALEVDNRMMEILSDYKENILSSY